MQKPVSREALVKESTFWTRIQMLAKENPEKVCHK